MQLTILYLKGQALSLAFFCLNQDFRDKRISRIYLCKPVRNGQYPYASYTLPYPVSALAVVVFLGQQENEQLHFLHQFYSGSLK